jgi:hypothetical protein
MLVAGCPCPTTFLLLWHPLVCFAALIQLTLFVVKSWTSKIITQYS